MKYLLFYLLLLLPCFLLSQDCDIKHVKNPDGSEIKKTDEVILSSGDFRVYIKPALMKFSAESTKWSTSHYLTIKEKDIASCIPQKAAFWAYFEDGTEEAYQHYGRFNCDGSYLFPLRGKDAMKDFADKKLKSFKVQTSNAFMEFLVPEEKAAEIQKAHACVVSNRE